MFINSWSLALTLTSFIVLFLLGYATKTAYRVLKFWNPDSDDHLQIALEGEIWLSSTLVQYALMFQIVSLCLFVMAADSFCEVIIGAMCATGALLANNFGLPTLLIKICGVFIYGYWIVVHMLDTSSEQYPLVKIKYRYFFLLLPLITTDIILQTLYLSGLSPDIITSCCGVIFDTSSASGQNPLGGLPKDTTLIIFYLTIAVVAVMSILRLRIWSRLTGVILTLLWLFFVVFAVLTITSVVSSYIYAMPFHNCPFCILKPEYDYIGFFIYGSLLGAAFSGISACLVDYLKSHKDLSAQINKFQKSATILSLCLLGIFTILTSYHYVMYAIRGGEF